MLSLDTLLIAHPSEDLCSILKQVFSKEYRVTAISDGQDALALILRQSFDALILALEIPNLDGLTILRKACTHLPPAVLALTFSSSPYAFQQAVELGAAHVLLMPCPIEAITNHILQIREHLRRPEPKAETPHDWTVRHLRILNIPDNRPGFRQLQSAIALYAQDPDQSMTKELYPAVAVSCGKSNGSQISKSIERTIKEAWETRSEQVWQEYFPHSCDAEPRCPTNHLFISHLANLLNQELNTDY